MMLKLKIAAAAASLACGVWTFSTTSAGAAVIYDNLSFPTTFSDSIRHTTDSGNAADGPLAASFSVNNFFTLNEVTVRVERESLNTTPDRSVTVALYSDEDTGPEGTHPGSLISVLGTFTDGDLPATRFTPIDLTFAPASGIDLAAGRYWVHLSTDSNSRAGWAAAGGDGSGSTYGTGPGEWGIGGQGEYFYAGGADVIIDFGTDVFPNGASPYLPYQMQVVADVPEPASLVLLSVGIGALGLLRFRRQRPAAAIAA